jgi:flagellar assembly factor FliW
MSTTTPPAHVLRGVDTVAPGIDGLARLELIEPFAGFDGSLTYALVRLDEEGSICQLQAVDRPELSFLVVCPHVFFPKYAPAIDATTMQALGIGQLADALLLVLVNPGATLADMTANLVAPILVNHRTRRAAQVVLEDSSLPLRAPLAEA